MASTSVNVEQTENKNVNQKIINNKISEDNHYEYNNVLDRNIEIEKLKEWLSEFEINKNEKNIQRGVYIYGAPGSGKTFFVKQLLKNLNYDIITMMQEI